ncbi:general substrate transporter [Talaromyces proteolyticus]|uniref:General substrate transporter n=1 Tax=Talaromyces proteolyticus TaxID=1131652 RepID=A0AAD4L4H0_9EURO|nr:general substrate transporter [Talaromyces proteolyticus]KAH8705802.1 general substrate transporter [Talaromyces proteolyticus]
MELVSHRTTWLRGTPLLSAITSVCASAFLLFGYDNGVMSGVVISSYWLQEMGHPSTIMVSTITALYDVGAVFGAIAAAFTAEKLGRKRSLIFGSIIVVIGSILMGTSVERVQMMVGRIATGFGIGYLTSAAPVYQSEVCLPSQRGWHMCSQLSMMLFGLMIAYWMNYGFYFHPGTLQWRFPLLFQIIFAVYMIIVGVFLPDTPRWLMWHRPSTDEGLAVLSRLRNRPGSDPAVVQEQDEILEAIRIESQEEGTWMDLFRDGGTRADKRFYLALGIQFMQQMAGINIITYYAPTLFTESLGMTQERALLVGSFLQVWYIFASFLTWFMIDVVGRRRLLISMALGMCAIMIFEAVCVAIDNRSSNIAAVALVFLFEGCFTWGWMACVWIYPPEILPLKIRAKGAALAAAADFVGNFLVVEITPPALQNIGYKTYIIFAVFNIVNAAIVFLFYPETMSLPLESVDLLFIQKNESMDETSSKRKSFYQHLQWWVVPKAWELVKEERTTGTARLRAEEQRSNEDSPVGNINSSKGDEGNAVQADHIG